MTRCYLMSSRNVVLILGETVASWSLFVVLRTDTPFYFTHEKCLLVRFRLLNLHSTILQQHLALFLLMLANDLSLLVQLHSPLLPHFPEEPQ